jgi:DNA-binding response OmpR family regulator
MRVLLIEDSAILLRTVRRALRHAGFSVDTAVDGVEGLSVAKSNDYDLLILDIMLPRLDGLTVLRRLREANWDTHVLLLTARDTVADRIEGLRQGADDYLIKPFAMPELIERARSLCRRAYGRKSSLFRIGSLELDLASRRLLRDGAEVELTAREWRLVEYLAFRRGQVVPRSEIEAHIYDELVSPVSNVIDSAVYNLRRKIGAQFIQTRRGLGYVFDAR